MKRIIALFVVLIFILSIFTTLTACKSNDDGEKNNSTTIYPIINYLPHYQTYFDDRWVSVRFSELGELEKARRQLLENGVEISEEKRVGFDYRSDEYVVKYWFDGILTLDSAKLTSERDYYELEYETATLECYLYFNAATTDGLPERRFLKGPHSYRLLTE